MIAAGLREGALALGVSDQTAIDLLQLVAKTGESSDAAMVSLSEALKDIDEQLQNTVCDEQAKIDNAHADQQMRVEAQAAAETSIAELKVSLSDARSAHAKALAAAKAATDSVVYALAEQTEARTEFKLLANKRQRIEAAKADLEPLNTTTTSGPDGQKRLKGVRKIGKQFGFHDVLLDALPAVLKKQPDRRQTFDVLTLRQLGVEFTKHGNKAGALMRGGEAAVDECAVAVKEAEEVASAAANLRNESARACARSESAWEKGKGTVTAARAHVRAFSADMRRAKRCLEKRTKQLSAFRSGPLAAFEALRSERCCERNGEIYGASGVVKLEELAGNFHVGSGGDYNGKGATEATTSSSITNPGKRCELPSSTCSLAR
jgi:hypothetical protein